MGLVAKSLSGKVKSYRQKGKPFVTKKVLSLFYKYGLYLPNKMI